MLNFKFLEKGHDGAINTKTNSEAAVPRCSST